MTVTAIVLLLMSALAVAGAGTAGNTAWAGNYRELDLGNIQHIASVTVTWATGTTKGTIYCGVISGEHYPPQASDRFAWVPKWGATNTTGVKSYAVVCDTSAIFVVTGAQPAPTDLAVNFPTPTSTAAPTATGIPPTNTPVPTATTPPTATGTTVSTPTTHNTCGDLGDGAVDQHGVSVDVWAPGLRIACGFPGYENGDDPMPPGTPLPPPRPFRFDYAVDHNEPVFGFKVFYRHSGDPRGCGDVRAILHQGDAVEGRFVRFHTFQFATAFCDNTGIHIIDVAGQTDSGGVEDQLNDNGVRPMKLMGTPDDFTQRGFLFDIYYNYFNFDIPGGPGYPSFVHQGFANDSDGISTFWDPNDSHHLQFVCHYINGRDDYSCGHDGSVHALRDLQYGIDAPSQTTWWAFFDPVRGVNTVVPAGTPGAWQMRVDKPITIFENGGVSHNNHVPGLQYPN
jgi:hypothetical protein